MRNVTKVFLVAALVLVLVGGAAFTVLLARCDWDFANLYEDRYKTNTYEITESVDRIFIGADTADIRILPAEDGLCRIVTHDHRDITYTPIVEEGTLTVRLSDERAWYDHIVPFGGHSSVTVYLPVGEYDALTVATSTSDVEISRGFAFGQMAVTLSTGDVTSSAAVLGVLSVTASTGDITLTDLSVGELSLSVSTGDVTLSEVACTGHIGITVTTGRVCMTSVRMESLTTEGDTGDIRLTGTVAESTLTIERSTGDVTLDGCDAAEVFIKTSTGDVRGRFLTDKVFLAETSSGKREVPRTTTGGRCEITTTTGDIVFSAP